MAEHHLAVVVLKVLVQPQARTGLVRTGASVALRTPTSRGAVVAVQLDQVEGEEEDAGVGAPIVDAVEARPAIIRGTPPRRR